MRHVATVLILFCSVCPLDAGRTIRITSPQFSFLINEPEGWMLDVRSAVQIANFVVHKHGTTWRYADVAVFGRFIPREDEESLEDFVKEDELRFQEGCPRAEITLLDLKLGEARSHEFLVKKYMCAGARSEVAAIAQIPGFFVLVSLTSQTGNEGIEEGLSAFRELLESFRFLPGAVRRAPVPSGRRDLSRDLN